MLHLILFLLCGIEAASMRCDNPRDCAPFSTFCHGPYLCNQSARCVPADATHNPCFIWRAYALSFTQRTAHTVSIYCLEDLRACIEVYYCLEDADCDDGIYCNGAERCVLGQCQPPLFPSCAVCDEETRCGNPLSALAIASDDQPANPSTVYAIVGVSLIVLAMMIIFALILVFRASDPYVLR